MRAEHFLSLRWRVGVFAGVLIIMMAAAYILASRWSGSTSLPQAQIWIEHQNAVRDRSDSLFAQLRAQAQQIAALENPTEEALQNRLQSADSAILLDADGKIMASQGTIEVNINALSDSSSAMEMVSVGDEVLIYTAARDAASGRRALVGQRVTVMLETLQAGSVAELVLLNTDNRVIHATIPAGSARFDPATVSDEPGTPAQSIEINNATYQVAYQPLAFGSNLTLGVMLPDAMPFAVEAGRQLTGLALAASAATFVITLFVVVNTLLARVNRVTQTVEKLADGEALARTGMQPTDEIGRLGQVLDRYADYVKERQDILRTDLRRQRREIEHLQAVLESMPDGTIVQDADGRVILMNENARRLLGSQQGSTNLEELTAHVTDKLGPALAPGLYSLGSPQQVDVNNRMLSAQAAAVTSLSGHRLGTVIVLRDITDEVRRERAREKMLQQLEQNVHQPLSQMANPARATMPITSFAREITRHAVALQKTVLEMRELADPNLRTMPDPVQHPILLDTLVWSVANEWRQVAQANNLTLHVVIERSGLYVLGNERRLRWAIGNIIDNAIKYTPPGGALTLEIRDDMSEGRAHLRVRDNGVGIAAAELPHVFTRFYRGNPTTTAGRVIRVPGAGQGLSTARQIFEAHGGSIHIKSRPGVGTAVYFVIPLTAPVGIELPAVDMEGETVRIRTAEIK